MCVTIYLTLFPKSDSSVIFLSRGGFLSVWYYWYDPTARSYCNTLHLQRSTVVAPLLLAFGLWALLSCGEACCDIGMTCPEVYQKVTWFAPRTEYPAWSFPNELSFPSHMAPVFLMCKIDFKMTFLKLLRWFRLNKPLPLPLADHRGGHLSVANWEQSLWCCLCVSELGSNILKHGIHTMPLHIFYRKNACVQLYGTLAEYIFKPKKKWKVPERQQDLWFGVSLGCAWA